MAYKGKYLIALYYGGPLDDEWPFGVYESSYDLAKTLHKNYDAVMSSIAHKVKYFWVQGKRCTIHLIPIDESSGS